MLDTSIVTSTFGGASFFWSVVVGISLFTDTKEYRKIGTLHKATGLVVVLALIGVVCIWR